MSGSLLLFLILFITLLVFLFRMKIRFHVKHLKIKVIHARTCFHLRILEHSKGRGRLY